MLLGAESLMLTRSGEAFRIYLEKTRALEFTERPNYNALRRESSFI